MADSNVLMLSCTAEQASPCFRSSLAAGCILQDAIFWGGAAGAVHLHCGTEQRGVQEAVFQKGSIFANTLPGCGMGPSIACWPSLPLSCPSWLLLDFWPGFPFILCISFHAGRPAGGCTWSPPMACSGARQNGSEEGQQGQQPSIWSGSLGHR